MIGPKPCKNFVGWPDIRWFFVKEATFLDKINLIRVTTKRNVAGSLTKTLEQP